MDRIQLKGTPFWQIKTENGYFIVMGENVITPVMETEKELDEYVKDNQWDMICLVTLTLIKHAEDKKIEEWRSGLIQMDGIGE